MNTYRLLPEPLQPHRVIDGDTLSVSVLTVDLGSVQTVVQATMRIVGIDAPEAKDPAQHAAAIAVVAIVKAWMDSPGQKKVQWNKLDNYARVDGDVFSVARGEFLSAYLLKRKVVHPYNGEGQRPAWTVEELSRIAKEKP